LFYINVHDEIWLQESHGLWKMLPNRQTWY